MYKNSKDKSKYVHLKVVRKKILSSNILTRNFKGSKT